MTPVSLNPPAMTGSIEGLATAEARNPRQIARGFVAARRAAESPIAYPGFFPRSLEEAYRIQDLAIAEDGGRIDGWKVGRIADADLPDYDANRLAGPIFERLVRQYDGRAVPMTVFAGGFGAAEAEFLLRIGSDVPPGQLSYTMEEAAELVDAVHVGIEIASSPFPGINAHGPAVTVSDFGNNNGLIVGAEVPDWRHSGFERWPVTLAVDGVEVGRATTETMLDGALGAVRFLLELLGRRGIVLPRGSWVSTGAVTGVHEVEPGHAIVAGFGPDLTVTCTIEAAKTA
jgi:2-keto-4-pentenoate hydratase